MSECYAVFLSREKKNNEQVLTKGDNQIILITSLQLTTSVAPKLVVIAFEPKTALRTVSETIRKCMFILYK